MGVSESARVPVLIVGAGPSGLLAAAELARHGVRARIVEREPVPPRQARATALQPGTLEILAQAGVVSQVLLSSVHLRYARVLDTELQPVAETDFAGVGCPWEFQCSLPQWRTEQILARLGEHGVVVDRGTEVVTMDDGGDRVRVTLKRPDGTTEIIEADWVIGAGGAHSVTRESMAVDLTGDTYPGTALVADVRVTCPIARDGSALIASPGGYVLLAPLPDGHWLTFVGDLHEDEAERLEHDISIGAVAGAIQRRAPDAIRLTDVGWAATFRMHRRLAPELADGRRFLLGDAGHLSSPFGGEGLNSGLHDAHNLAWKLALELQGRARPALIDSFAAERGAAARHVLETSDRLHQLVHAAVESARTGSRSAAPSPEQARALLRARSMLDVCYAGSALAAEYATSGNAAPEEAASPRRSLSGSRPPHRRRSSPAALRRHRRRRGGAADPPVGRSGRCRNGNGHGHGHGHGRRVGHGQPCRGRHSRTRRPADPAGWLHRLPCAAGGRRRTARSRCPPRLVPDSCLTPSAAGESAVMRLVPDSPDAPPARAAGDAGSFPAGFWLSEPAPSMFRGRIEASRRERDG